MARGSNPDLIRSRSLMGYGQLVRQLGGDPESLLKRFGLEAVLDGDGDSLIPYTSRLRLLETTAATLQCPDFGLRLAQKQDLRLLGPLALIAQNSRTAGQAVSGVVRAFNYHSGITRVGLEQDASPHLRRLTFSVFVEGLPQRRQSIEQTLGLMLIGLRQLLGPAFTPDHVLLRHDAGMPSRLYRRWFSCPVLFCQDVNALVLEAARLDEPIDQSNPDLLRIAESYVASEISRRPMDTPGQVEALVDLLLQTDRCTLEYVAERLRMHKRSLQRRLASDGTSFDTILDRRRRQRAEEYLAQRNVPLSQAALLIGFAEQSSFNKACRRWFGMPPKAVRDKACSGDDVQPDKVSFSK